MSSTSSVQYYVRDTDTAVVLWTRDLRCAYLQTCTMACAPLAISDIVARIAAFFPLDATSHWDPSQQANLRSFALVNRLFCDCALDQKWRSCTFYDIARMMPRDMWTERLESYGGDDVGEPTGPPDNESGHRSQGLADRMRAPIRMLVRDSLSRRVRPLTY
jgi:hypothetical protein